ncbi:MAG: tryptophan synthase subunit alpha [Candidatus Aenigmarchaeota archaeon]|nr:tryptophan synthase subunit alpha [Candidatus Aenigmarchaeota archaeon]
MEKSNSYLQARKKKGKSLFIPFVVLGDPNKNSSLEIVKTLIENGANALELGFPFSDPPADGPVIQAADMRALESGICTDDCFDLLKDIRKTTDIPIGLLIYYNLILQRGVDRFYKDCSDAGVNSVLIADLPLEHAQEVVPIAKKHGIAPVFIISELSSDERIKNVAEMSDGYLYVVSYLGVTGVKESVLEGKIKDTIDRARKYTNLPLCVGFGINSAQQAQVAVKAGADGVIVGSRIIKEVPNTKKIAQICEELRLAIG